MIEWNVWKDYKFGWNVWKYLYVVKLGLIMMNIVGVVVESGMNDRFGGYKFFVSKV